MKVASRYLIPVELLMALYAMSWALSGGIGDGRLYELLAARGLNLQWLLLLGGIASAQLIVSSVEWVVGRHWSSRAVFVSTSARCVLAFFMALMWIYTVRVVMLEQDYKFITVLLVAPVSIAFACWSFVENLKVRYALNPHVSTKQLYFHR